MKKKFIIIFAWIIVINILINVFYYLIIENGFEIITRQFAFRKRYYFREIVNVNLDYNNYENNNIFSKDNMFIELSNIDYEKWSGKLKTKFTFYMNNDDVLDTVGGILRIYDDKKIFYHGYLGGYWDSNNMEYLMFDENIYGEVNLEDLYNKKLYGELDDTNLNLDEFIIFNNVYNNEPIEAELSLNLGKEYEISEKLYIDIIDFQYKSVDEFLPKKIFNPLGEIKFIVNF